jgi:hypothetical protein
MRFAALGTSYDTSITLPERIKLATSMDRLSRVYSSMIVRHFSC